MSFELGGPFLTPVDFYIVVFAMSETDRQNRLTHVKLTHFVEFRVRSTHAFIDWANGRGKQGVRQLVTSPDSSQHQS